MPLSAADLSTLSRLLDEAMELPAAEVDPWLAALPAEHAALLPSLRAMLSQRTDARAFMQSPPWIEPHDDSIARAGDLVGPYRLVREIGKGGMGSVWLAEQVDGRLKRSVALKLPRLAWGAGLAQRMRRERDIGALLEHPSIARLYDAGLDEKGRPYLALAYIDGIPLDVWCQRKKPSIRERLRLFLQIARAVAYAHGRLVVHRDLKPSNVLVDAEGRAHLLDFGIAKLLDDTSSGERDLTADQGRVMTLHYASPEQLAGGTITVGSDIYSLGALLHELLTGQHPYALQRATLGSIEHAVSAGEPAPASSKAADAATANALRGELDAIVGKALKREPVERYGTADAFADDVERYLNGERVLARPDTLAYRVSKTMRRHWLGVTATACVLLAVVAGATATTVQARRAIQAAERERVVKGFITDLFRADSRARSKASREKAQASPFIEGGAQLIEARFKAQPELQAELYGLVAGVFLDMGANSLAADYATRQLAAMHRAGATSIEQAGAEQRIALAMLGDGRLKEAAQLASGVLARVPERDPAHLQTQVLLARIRFEQRELDELKRLLADIDKQLDASPGTPSADRAWATAVRAGARALDDVDMSIPMFDRAIEIAQRAEGEHSPTATAIRLTLAAEIGGGGSRPGQSQSYFDQAIADLEEQGGIFENRAALERARYVWTRAVGGRGSTPLAQQVIADSRARLLASPTAIPGWYIPQLDFWSASLKTRMSDLSDLAVLEASVEQLKGALQSPAAQIDMAYSLAIALMTAGRHDSADAWFVRNIELRRGADGDGSHLMWSHAIRASNRMMQGRYDDALVIVGDARRLKTSPTRDPRFVVFPNEALAATEAETRLLAGDAGAAAEIIRAAATRPRSADAWDRDLGAWTGKVYGEALCRTGRAAEGLGFVQQYVSFQMREKASLEVDPATAEARAIVGLCALDAGQPAEARHQAALARRAFELQPQVSSYFKAPLVSLDRRLGGQATTMRALPRSTQKSPR